MQLTHFALAAALFLPTLVAPSLATAETGTTQKPAIRVQNLAEQEVTIKQADGKLLKKRQPVEKALPGSEVIYTTRFTNESGKPARNIVLNNRIPENTEYVGGSADGEQMNIVFSLDGKNFKSPDKLTVRTAEGKERPAAASEYTHVRWIYQGELPPGKTGEAVYRIRIK